LASGEFGTCPRRAKIVAHCLGGRRNGVRHRVAISSALDGDSAYRSPSLMLMLSSGKPSMSAATCAMMV
jgi:hypothetical protein